MAAILYINSPTKIVNLVVVRKLNNFSAQTDLFENRILENWIQNCDIKCTCVGVGKRNRLFLCMWDRIVLLALLFLVLMCIYSIVVLVQKLFSKSPSNYYFFVGIGGDAPQTPDGWISCNIRGKIGEGEIEDDRGMVMEVERVVRIQNLGGRLVLIFIRAGISVCVVEGVVVEVVFFRERSLSVTEVECLGVRFGLVRGGICNLGRSLWLWRKWRCKIYSLWGKLTYSLSEAV